MQTKRTFTYKITGNLLGHGWYYNQPIEMSVGYSFSRENKNLAFCNHAETLEEAVLSITNDGNFQGFPSLSEDTELKVTMTTWKPSGDGNWKMHKTVSRYFPLSQFDSVKDMVSEDYTTVEVE